MATVFTFLVKWNLVFEFRLSLFTYEKFFTLDFTFYIRKGSQQKRQIAGDMAVFGLEKKTAILLILTFAY